MQDHGSQPEISRMSLILAALGTIASVAIGYLISDGQASSILPGLALLAGATLIAFVSPAAGISSVLFAIPTFYDLYPMPRGDFSLLELAIVTATVGIGARIVLGGFRFGVGELLDILYPAQIIVPVGMLLVATAISLATLADPGHRSESLREVRTVIIEPLLFLAVSRMAMRQKEVRWFAGSMVVAVGVVISGYAVAQIALDLGGVEAGNVTRATATYTHPNNLALFLERTILVTLGVGIVRPRWWPVWVLAAVQFVGLALTFSRGALIALVAGIAVLLVLRGLYKWLLLLMAGGVGVAAVGLVLFPDRLVDAGGSGAEPTRFTIWRAGWHMAMDHPIFGVGPDQFLYQYSRRFIEPMGWPERYTSHPHNLLLDTWLRLGVLGLAGMATLAAGLLWWTKKMLAPIRQDVWAMGAIAALVGGAAHGMVDNGFFLPDLATFTWFCVALLVTVPASREPAVATMDRNQLSMERTWPAVQRTQPESEPIGTAIDTSTIVIGGAGAMFVLLQFLPTNGYLAFAMIALAGIVAIINAPLMIGAVLLSIPIQESAVVPFVRGELTYTQILLFGLVLGWAVTFFRRRIWLDSIVLGFLAVFAAFFLSLLEMDSLSLWVGEVYRWAAAAAFFIICRSVLRTWEDVVPVIWAAILGVIGVSAHSFWQVATGAGPENFVVGGAVRVFSTFGTPNPLAAYIEFTVPVLAVFALLGFRESFRETIGRPVWFGSMAASGVGMLTLGLTQSRGGWVGMAFALLVVFAVLPRKIQLGTVLIGGVCTVAFLITPVGQSQVSRFSDVFREDETAIVAEHQYALGRGSLWGAAVRMIEDEPVTGIGAGEYDYHYREYTPSWRDRFPRGQAHNGWLQMGAQAGVPGMIAFTGWLAASIIALAGAIRRAPTDLARSVSWGALAVMVAFTMHSLVDYLNVLSLSLQISAITAIGLCLAPEPLTAYRKTDFDKSAVSPDMRTVGLAS